MHFAILNESKDPSITVGILDAIASACERQLYEHFAPFWESAGAPVVRYNRLASIPANFALIVILDSADQAGVLGYHDVTPDGRAYAKVFWDPIKKAGGSLFADSYSLSVTLSHEILEIAADPYASFWASNPDTGLFHAIEIADPVETESYVIDGIHVSNFVGPRFYRKGPGPYDWMSQLEGNGNIHEAFQTAPGGYQIVAPNFSEIKSIFADLYPVWRKDTKAHTASRTAKRGARATLVDDE